MKLPWSIWTRKTKVTNASAENKLSTYLLGNSLEWVSRSTKSLV